MGFQERDYYNSPIEDDEYYNNYESKQDENRPSDKRCDYCGNEIEPYYIEYETGGLKRIRRKTITKGFVCKRCGGLHCGKCRLPENHNCIGLHHNKHVISDIHIEVPVIKNSIIEKPLIEESKKPHIKPFTRGVSLQRFCTILIILLIVGICYEVCSSFIDPDSEDILNDTEISQTTALLSLQSFLMKDTTNEIKSDKIPNAEYAKSLSENASKYNINLGGFILHTGNNNSKYVLNYCIINNTFIIINPKTDELYNLSQLCKSNDFPIAYRYITFYPDVTFIPNYKILKRTREFDRLSPINDSEIINKINHIYSKKLEEHITTSEPESTVTQTLCTLPEDTQVPFITPTSNDTEKLTQKNETEKIAQIIYEETNKERLNYGLLSLKSDVKLSEIALEHSADMAENDFFSHTNLRGEEPTDRALRHGYYVRKDYGSYYMYGIGENIGMMPTGNVIGIGYVNTIEEIGRAQVKSWMDSPGHRQNILNNEYDVIGIGVSYDGQYYISTQNFK